jgi:hypothetical protein
LVALPLQVPVRELAQVQVREQEGQLQVQVTLQPQVFL